MVKSGEAGNTVVSITMAFAAVIILVVFPLMKMAEEKDNISQSFIQSATTEFVNDIRTTAYLTQEKYDNFVLTLASTGNSYDVKITVQRFDDNPAKKVTSADSGDGVYYTEYTTQVLEQLPMKLNERDIVTVEVENTNVTINSQLRNFMYRVTGNNTGNIVAQESGMVTKSYAK